MARKQREMPVDKSVVKLWKDSAEGRSYWLGAIAAFTANRANCLGATQQTVQGQAKKFPNCPQSLVDSGFQLFDLPPETVDRPVDNVRVHGCKPRRTRRSHYWLFFIQQYEGCP
jgi:hypothetical protein